MDSFLNLVRSRRSIRRYSAAAVSDEQMAAILEAGRLAPSGNNAQPWRFIVVRDEGVKRRLYEAAGRQSFILEAPVVIAAVADPKAKIKRAGGGSPSSEEQIPTLAVIKAVRDTAIAADHMVLQACDMGLGSCWVAKYEQEDIRPVLGVPEDCFVVTLITLGEAAHTPKESARYPIHEITFDDQYGRRVDFDEYETRD